MFFNFSSDHASLFVVLAFPVRRVINLSVDSFSALFSLTKNKAVGFIYSVY